MKGTGLTCQAPKLKLVQLLRSSKAPAQLAFHSSTGFSDSSSHSPVSRSISNWGRTSLRGRAQRWCILSKLTHGRDTFSPSRSLSSLCCYRSAVATQLCKSSRLCLLKLNTNDQRRLSQYVFRMAGRAPAAWEQKGVAIAGYTVAVIRESCRLWLLKVHTDNQPVGISSNRLSLLFSDVVGFIKLSTLVL